jgi:hypothetical protein
MQTVDAAMVVINQRLDDQPQLRTANWGTLSQEVKNEMVGATLVIAVREFDYLEIIRRRCANLWPCECLLQPKWSQRATIYNNRIRRYSKKIYK